jgi:pyridoxal phosphate enzyme (YggS family)
MDRKELIRIRLELIKRPFHPDHPPTLVAVTKKQPLEDIVAAYEVGQRDFGENRVDELYEKAKALHDKGFNEIRWHFIGNLQSNKMAKLLEVPNLWAIHSLTSYESLQKLIQKREHFSGEKLHLFLQVNTSNEKEKGGFIDWDELAKAVNLLIKEKLGPFDFYGLMTMSKLRTNNFEEDALKCFEHLKKIKDSLIKDFDLSDLKLSMGMSSDYELALQVGTDFVRVGSALFAPYKRPSN